MSRRKHKLWTIRRGTPQPPHKRLTGYIVTGWLFINLWDWDLPLGYLPKARYLLKKVRIELGSIENLEGVLGVFVEAFHDKYHLDYWSDVAEENYPWTIGPDVQKIGPDVTLARLGVPTLFEWAGVAT